MFTFIFGLLLGIEEWLHAAIVQTIRFHEVDDHEFVLDIFTGIGHWKEIPLGMWSCIPVCSKNYLVLILQYLYGSSDIPCLKSTLEYESCISLWCWDVVGEKIDSVGFRIDWFAEWSILLIVYYFVEESVHEDNDLYILFYRFFKNVRLGLKNWIALLDLRL